MKDQIVEYRIKDLVAMLLKAFRPILCTTLVFALAGGCLGLYRSINPSQFVSISSADIDEARDDVALAEAKLQEAENTLSRRVEIEIPDAETLVIHAQQLVNSRQDYIDNSLYYALNPFHCGVSTHLLSLSSEKGNMTSESDSKINLKVLVDDAKAQLFSESSEEIKQLRSILKTDAEAFYIEEIITLSAVSNQTIEITVYNADSTTAADAVEYLIEKMTTLLTGKIPQLTLDDVDYYTGYEINWNIYNRNQESKEKLISAEQMLTSARETLYSFNIGTEKLELAVESAKAELETQQNNQAQLQRQLANSRFSLRSLVKWTLLFAVLFLLIGLFFASFIAIISATVSGKVQNQNMIQSYYDIPLLGVLPPKTSRPFEKTIRKLEGESMLDYSSATSAIAQTMLAVIGDRSVGLISSLGNEEAEVFLPFIAGRTQICGDIIRDQNAEKALISKDSVILVEKKGRSTLSMIDLEIQRTKALNKELLGIILT